MNKRLLIVALILGIFLVTALPAFAKVHGPTQAGCAHFPEKSGANMSGDNSPDGPIPVTASDGRFQGKAGDGDPFCDVPPGPPAAP